MRITSLAVIPLLLLAVACGSDEGSPIAAGASSTTTSTTTTSAPPAAATCSTSGLRITLADQDLPDAVASKRKAIFDAAVACDYDALAAEAGPQFNFTFGDGDAGPAAYWKAREADDEQVLKVLVQVLNLPHVDRRLPDGGARYTSWPSADQDVRTQADWDALQGIYTEAQVEQFQAADSYTGYRTAITESGDWMYFVAGD
jgi:hypothetical protein